MVTKEFITELERTRDLFEWKLTTCPSPFAERRAVPRLRVRATLKNNPVNTRFEPIGAVCFLLKGLTFSEDYWVEAAISIGLSVQDARDLLAAANDMTWRNVADNREPDPYRMALRKWLVEATGLDAGAAPGA
ncbi:MAG TPA: hypothetical protein VFY29_19865 [Terriglobia bacterium]|nr:hypothetical protein [Terriglobia bacterium]